MPAAAIYVAFVLALVVATAAALDRCKARRRWRALVWAALVLSLPFSLAAFLVLVWLWNGAPGRFF